MSLLHSPSIVSNGLVLFYDAANQKSYPGDSTTNLITSNPLPSYADSSGYTGQGGTYSVVYDTNNAALLWTQTSYSAWGCYLNNNTYFNGTLSTSSQYTLSFEWKTENNFSDTNYTAAIVQGNGTSPALAYTSIVDNSTYIGNGWKRFSYTFTPLNTGVGAYARINLGNTGVTGKMWFKKMQLEQKSYRTPFVIGTRSASILDLTDNVNTGTLSGGLISNSTNGGVLVFDGTDDYISAGDPASLNFGIGNFTIAFTTYTTAYGLNGGSYVGKGNGTTIGFDCRDNQFFVYGSAGEIARGAFQATLNTWQYHTIVYSTSSSPYVTFYTNGVVTGSSSINNAGNLSSINTTSHFRIGLSVAGGPNRFFNGNISLVKAYNRALTALEVQQNFNAIRGRYGL